MGISMKDKAELYLFAAGALCAILIVLFQQYPRVPSYSFVGGLLLSLIGVALFLFLGKYCEKNVRRLVLLGSLYLIVAYLAWPNRSFWLEWHDQGYYYRMLSELASGFLTSENFRYGMGYPILAVPFYYLVGKDALFIPNLVFFGATLSFSFAIFRSLTNNLTSKIAILLLIFGTTFPYHHVIWWGHGTVIFCFMLVSYLSLKTDISNKALIAIGLATGYSFFTRYAEIIVFLPMIVFLFWRKKSKAFALVILGIIPMILATFFAHWIIFGNPLMTPYRVELGQAQIFFPEDIPQNIFFTFLYYPPEMALGDPAVGTLKFPVLTWAFFFVFAPLGMYRALRNHQMRVQKKLHYNSCFFCHPMHIIQLCLLAVS